MSSMEEILAQCTNVLPGHGRSDSAKEAFQRRFKEGEMIINHNMSALYASRVLKSGAAGYLTKEAAPEVIAGGAAETSLRDVSS